MQNKIINPVSSKPFRFVFFLPNQSGFRLTAVGRSPNSDYSFTGRNVASGSQQNKARKQ